jgi:hypothetical protein
MISTKKKKQDRFFINGMWLIKTFIFPFSF